MKSTILVTGGAGFIGSHLIRFFLETYKQYHIINLDQLTYAASLKNLQSIEENERYTFIKGDICNKNLVEEIFSTHEIGGG